MQGRTHRRKCSTLRLCGQVLRQDGRRNEPRLLDGRNLFGDIFQLTDIAPPIVILQHLPGLGVQRNGRHTVLGRDIGRELAEKQENILLPFPQRRHQDRHRIEPIIEILAETSRLDRLLQIRIRRRYHAHVGLLHLGRTDADELAGLQHTQQPHLGRMRQLGHLVQKDRPAVRLLEITLAGFDCSGEGPLLVSEQFGIDRSFGNGAAVHGDIFIVFTCRIGMDHLREKLLANAAFTRNEYRKIGRRHTQGNLQRTIERLGVADDPETVFYGCQICHSYSINPILQPIPANYS